MTFIFVGCQPIYKSDLAVYAFELLFRGGATNQATWVHSRFAFWFCVFMRVFVRICWGLQIFVSWIGESSSSRGDECDVCGIASV